jgi:ornithine cyclodeaminase/alanine dehydrogenase-like protein (mu-crystallin family)
VRPNCLFSNQLDKRNLTTTTIERTRMKITEIVVTAARTFNHPFETYSNLRPEVTLKATLSDSEDPTEAVKSLQSQAEGIVEDHKQTMLQSLVELHNLTERQAEVRGLQKEMQRAQDRLKEIRNEHPQLALGDA